MRNFIRLFTSCLLLTLGLTLDAQDYGIATYYDDAFHGRRTSSGEIYNKNELTAAYKKYDYGTILKVTRLDNNRSVQVRIIDNGPFIKGRLIELSRRAAERLDMIGELETEVKVELVKRGDGTVAATNIESGDLPAEKEVTIYEAPEKDPPQPQTPVAETPVVVPPPSRPDPEPKQEIPVVVANPEKKEKPAPPQPKALDEDAVLLRKGNFSTYDLYKIQVLRPQRKGYGVQVAYISNYENVFRQIAELQEQWFKNILISVEKGKNNQPVYRIILGPFPDQETAESYKKRLKSKKKINGFLVNLEELQYR